LFHTPPPWPTPASPGLHFGQKLRGRNPGDGVAPAPASDGSKQSARVTSDWPSHEQREDSRRGDENVLPPSPSSFDDLDALALDGQLASGRKHQARRVGVGPLALDRPVVDHQPGYREIGIHIEVRDF